MEIVILNSYIKKSGSHCVTKFPKFIVVSIAALFSSSTLLAEELPDAASLFAGHVEASYGKDGLKKNIRR